MDYLSVPHKDLKDWIRLNINEVCSSYVQTGWLLNLVKERGLYCEDGYKGIGDYAAAEYGISPDRCSWLMKVAEKFCEKDTPELLQEYKDFSISKLREMVYLDDTQLGEIKPGATVQEIRQMKPKPEKEKAVKPELAPCTHEHVGCNRNSSLRCSGNKYCCADCTDHCNGYCGRVEDNGWSSKAVAVSKADETVIESAESVAKPEDSVIKPISTECLPEESCDAASEEPEEDEESKLFDDNKITLKKYGEGHIMNVDAFETQVDIDTDINRHGVDPALATPQLEDECTAESESMESEDESFTYSKEMLAKEMLAKEMLSSHQRNLKEVLEFDQESMNSPSMQKIAAKRKLEVEAFTAFVAVIEGTANDITEPSEQAQPELPAMKNNDQRKAFLDSYETWPVWIDNQDTMERYYRYGLPDGNSIVIKVYFTKTYDWHQKKDTGHWGCREVYLLKPDSCFKDCETNTTAVVEHLKNMQKK